MKTILALILFLFAVPSQADEFNLPELGGSVNPTTDKRWSTTNTALEGGYMVLHYIDWRQTRHCAAHPVECKEVTAAWAIGEHPSKQSVNNFFIVTALLHGTASYYLPDKYILFGVDIKPRLSWQIVTVTNSAYTVYRNYAVRVKYDF